MKNAVLVVQLTLKDKILHTLSRDIPMERLPPCFHQGMEIDLGHPTDDDDPFTYRVDQVSWDSESSEKDSGYRLIYKFATDTKDDSEVVLDYCLEFGFED